MRNFETIEIKLSKSKSLLMLVGCLLFIASGVDFVVSPKRYVSIVAHSPKIIFIVGCIGIVFFGFLGLSILKILAKNEPGLIISKEGITDNSGGVSAGFIPWSDILAINEQVIANQRFINLVVKDPQEYINRQRSAFKRKVMQKNHDIFGTGIGISTNTLNIRYKELKRILEEKISETRNERN